MSPSAWRPGVPRGCFRWLRRLALRVAALAGMVPGGAQPRRAPGRRLACSRRALPPARPSFRVGDAHDSLWRVAEFDISRRRAAFRWILARC